jgi:transglutaminase-like putative cysteine protease
MRYDTRLKPTELGFDRRAFLQLAGTGSAALFLGDLTPAWAADQVVDPADVSLMQFDVSYRTHVMDLPSDAEIVKVWMPLPSSDHAQQVDDLVITSSQPWEIRTEPVYGARIVHVETGPELFDIEARYRITRRRAGAEKVELAAADAKKYLRPTNRVRVTPEVEAFATEVIGDATEPTAVARKLFDGIREYLVYDKKIPGCGTGDTAWLMRHKRGKCDDYHALFMAIMMSRGIPVRWEQGFPLPLPSSDQMASGSMAGDCTGAHCWASFYDPARGWVPVDVSEADKGGPGTNFYFGEISPNRFKVSEGRAVVLDPPQGGDPMPNFAYAYAEADEIPLIYAANYENLIDFEITRVERD